MSSKNPDDSLEQVEPDPAEELPPPPPPEPEAKPAAPAKAPEEIWMEDYDELIGPEEKPKPRKRKKRHLGAIITVVIVIIFLLAWTIMSPEVMTRTGRTYVDSPTYARWGNFTGSVDTWAGDVTWGLSIGGRQLTTDNRSLEVRVLLTKISENTSNWFFRGASATLKNVSVFLDDGAFVASMSNWTDVGFGIMATVPVTFDASGNYTLYVYAKFTMFGSMRIGFLPLKAVEIQAAYFNAPVEVT